jgi:hypothetical protein
LGRAVPLESYRRHRPSWPGNPVFRARSLITAGPAPRACRINKYTFWLFAISLRQTFASFAD